MRTAFVSVDSKVAMWVVESVGVKGVPLVVEKDALLAVLTAALLVD